ncbi:MAG: zf-HC2 domain-containing protein [Actinomycetes bacterium]
MADEHRRYEGLAVGHVLGGLDPVDAAEFRAHLTGCRACLMRVAELRDIATEMAAAEREERAAARVKTEVARRVDEAGDEEPPPARPRLRGLAVGAVAAGIALLLGLLVWNFHLREVNEQLLQVATTREAILELLARGTPAPLLGDTDLAGTVVVSEGQVAVDVAEVPAFGTDRVLVTWLVDEEGTASHRFEPLGPARVDDGLLALRGEHHGAARLVVSLEVVPLRADQTGQLGQVLLEADLAAARAAAG